MIILIEYSIALAIHDHNDLSDNVVARANEYLILSEIKSFRALNLLFLVQNDISGHFQYK